jgi:uncharacterized protein YkwD
MEANMPRGLAGVAAMLALAFYQPPADPARGLERRAFEEVNRERVRLGLSPLAWSEPLAGQARAHSERMRDLRYFSHQDPGRGDVASRLTHARIRWRACAENIYQERGYHDPAFTAVTSWMGSPDHRRNMLSPRYRRTGVGVASGRDGTYYLTQIFVWP